MEVSSVLPVGALLGEGPVWTRSAIWFVDIKTSTVHRYRPDNHSHRSWAAPEQVGWILPSCDGLMLAGLKTGIHRFEPERGEFRLLLDPEPNLPGNRLNDATTDPQGRVWFGSMDDGEAEATGRFYRMSDGKVADVGIGAMQITNGSAFSPDGSTFYYTDTLERTVWRAELDERGLPRRSVPHLRFDEGDGYPDGSVVDADGCLWVAMWGGWCVRRYDPAGRLIERVALPCAHVTKLAFGGDGLRIAFVTTARKGLSDKDLAEQPLAGNLFAFEPGCAGLPVTLAIV